MSEKLTVVLAKMEKQYDDLKRDFADDGKLTDEEIAVLRSVRDKLQVVRDKVGSAGVRGVDESKNGAKGGAGAKSGDKTQGGPKGKPPKGEVQMGDAQITRRSLGPSVDGPLTGELWMLMNKEGGEMTSSDSKAGARLNDLGRAALSGFARQKTGLTAWLGLVDQVEALAKSSAGGLAKMEKATGAVGGRSQNRPGTYVRERSEAYIKAERKVRDQVRGLGQLEDGLRQAISKLREEGLGKEVKDAERAKDKAKDAVEDEKKRIEEAKKRLNDLLGMALSIASAQAWVGVADAVTKYVGSELFEALPTGRLDQLKQQLEKASSDLVRVEDEHLMAKLETASIGLSKATKSLEDGRNDVLDAIKDLKLAQKTAVEALAESPSTAPAAKMIALRGKMLDLMANTNKAIVRWIGESPAYLTEIAKLAGLYKGIPGLIKQTPGIDPKSEFARSLGVTAVENYAALGTWKAYFVDCQKTGQGALRKLADQGSGGYLVHFNRVSAVLEKGIVER